VIKTGVTLRALMLKIKNQELDSVFSNVKSIYKDLKPTLNRELQKRIESWIKNIPKIIKNPNISWYTEGGQTYYHCVHPPKNEGGIPIPYSQTELDILNENEKFPYLKIEYPKSKYCLYCHNEVDIL